MASDSDTVLSEVCQRGDEYNKKAQEGNDSFLKLRQRYNLF